MPASHPVPGILRGTIAVAFFAILFASGLPEPAKARPESPRVVKHDVFELPERFVVLVPMPGFPALTAALTVVPEDLPSPSPLAPVIFIRRGTDGLPHRVHVPAEFVPAALAHARDVSTLFLDV